MRSESGPFQSLLLHDVSSNNICFSAEEVDGTQMIQAREKTGWGLFAWIEKFDDFGIRVQFGIGIQKSALCAVIHSGGIFLPVGCKKFSVRWRYRNHIGSFVSGTMVLEYIPVRQQFTGEGHKKRACLSADAFLFLFHS